ncbi:MAG TPA: hypothetical protein VFX59_14085 [Polyangiales bacterium]|nr:hypothetical protein [Polyangiales bacterium]
MTVSWLQLERYALGELSGDERSQVERELADSSEDRACLDAILSDDTVLPPLPVPLRKKRTAWWAGAAALAAALALMLMPRDLPSHRSVSDGVKGGEVAITLISERTGAAARSFRDGDRFKLLLTCPTWLTSRVHVVMFQDGQRYTPLSDTVECGNQVPWPGAFSLDGSGAVDVCVTWTDANVRAPRDLEPDAVCERLRHE